MDNIKEYIVKYKPNRIQIVSGLEQWDYGQYLVIKDIPLDLLEEKEIHFCFPNSLKSVVVKAEYESDALKAKIPKFIFQKQIESCLYSSYKAYAFVYLKTNEYGKTIHRIALEIEVRPKPDDYEYEEEQLYFEELTEVLDGKADNIRYSGNILYLLAGENILSRVIIRSGSGGGTGTGTDGREIELQNNGTYIQWRYVGDEEWINLVSLSDLKGENGITPHIGENGNWFLGEEDTNIKAKGMDGRGIKSIEKTATNENIDTYTITFTDDEKFEYTVTNAVQSSGESFSGKAEDVSYDDEETQLGADNVQDAVRQLSEQIADQQELIESGELNGKDGLSIYSYNGNLGVSSISDEPTNGDESGFYVSDINIPSDRELQIGDLLIDTVGNVVRVISLNSISVNTTKFEIEFITTIIGAKGEKGDTPQKGVDYFTEADTQELVTNVLNALPTWQGGAY